MEVVAVNTLEPPPAPSRVMGPELFPLALPPSCIEFCPAHPDYVLVGTYNLQEDGEDYTGTANVPGGEQKIQEPVEVKEEPDDGQEGMPAKKEQSRNGSLVLFHRQNNRLKLIQTLPTPSAILDLHFHPDPQLESHFGAVSSTGTFITGRIEPLGGQDGHNGPVIQIDASSIIPGIGEEVIFTSFIWLPDVANTAAITTTTGQVWVVALDSASKIGASQQLPLSSKMETWCVAMSPVNPKTGSCMIYSGGDDCILRCTSLKMLSETKVPTEDEKPQPTIKSGDTEEATDTPLWQKSFEEGPHMIVDCFPTQQLLKNAHTAGVTAILPFPPCQSGLELILTGSYDERVRVFLMKDPRSDIWGPLHIAEVKVGGGVWKLQMIQWRVGEPQGGIRGVTVDVLASCMHAGPKVLRFHVFGSEVHIDVVNEFPGHTLNYASHFQKREGAIDFVTTSFYDKKLNWWVWEENK